MAYLQLLVVNSQKQERLKFNFKHQFKQSFSSGCLLVSRDWKYDAREAPPNRAVGFLQLQNKNIKPLIYAFSLSS